MVDEEDLERARRLARNPAVTAAEFMGVRKVDPKRVAAVESLISDYGEDAPLGSVLRRLLGKKKFRCPKCGGAGFLVEHYNAYPSGLPDSFDAYLDGTREVPCDLCGGEGWLDRPMRRRWKTVEDGWEAAPEGADGQEK